MTHKAHLKPGHVGILSFSFSCWHSWLLRSPYPHRTLKPAPSLPRLLNGNIFVQPYHNLNKSHPHLELIGWFPPSNSMQMGCEGNITMKPQLEVLFEIGNKVCVMGFCRKLGVTSSLTADLWALRDGLKLLVDKGLNYVEIEVDAVCITPYVFKYKTQNMSKANTKTINWRRQ